MKLKFAEIVDTVDGAIDYLHRIRGGGTAAKLKESIPWSLPGYFYRAHDADEDNVGTEDCLIVEGGDHRHVIATRNATAWGKLLDYMDLVWSRVMDKGETVIFGADGSAACIITVRPNGELRIRTDNLTAAPGDKTCDIWLDPATGNCDITPGGTTPGELRIGGALATDYVTLFNALKAEVDAWTVEYNAHGHTAPGGGGPTTPPENPPGGPPSVQNVLTNAPRSTRGRAI